MSKKLIDLVIHIDALILDEGENVEDIISNIESQYPSSYDYLWEVTYEEIIDD